MNHNDFSDRAADFLTRLEKQIHRHGVVLKDHWDVDHLCYRVESLDSYRIRKSQFSQFGRCLIESQVNGRAIATFKLDEPIEFGQRFIDLLELPAPKPGKVATEGFEHIEVVVDTDLNSVVDDNPHLNFDRKGLDKFFNPELEISLGAENIKMHQISLESVVRLESNRFVWDAIQACSILQTLRAFNPVIVGTFPLGIETASSDVDILVGVKTIGFNGWREFCEQNLSKQDDYLFRDSSHSDDPRALVRFTRGDVKFEVFAQELESTRQNGFIHFQAEEKLLKYGGATLMEMVRKNRASGMKTEAAFAEALGISGDPYAGLAEIQRESISSLRKRLRDQS